MTACSQVGDPRFLRRLCADIPRLDVVVDDASHINWHQILAFKVLFPCLSPGGVYITEDIDTSYKVDATLGGGLRSPGSFVEFAKAKLDELQAYWTCRTTTIVGPDGACADGHPSVRPTELTRTLAAVHFHNGLVVFEKSHRPIRPAVSVAAGMLRVPKRSIAFQGVTKREARWLQSHTADERHNSQRASMDAAHPGHCGETSFGEGDCSSGSSGAWHLGLSARRTWKAALHACATHCAGCWACKHISVSKELGDCSWYARCEVRTQSANGFRSWSFNTSVLGGGQSR